MSPTFTAAESQKVQVATTEKISSAMPVVVSKKLYWVRVETKFICRAYVSVSEQYGGPGIYQTTPQFWNKFTTTYHSFNPPALTNKEKTVVGPPRTKSALLDKWNRLAPILHKFIKKMAFEMQNYHSGETTEQTLDRAILSYND